MLIKLVTLLIAALAILSHALPVSPLQALIEAQHAESDVSLLMSYILQSNGRGAQTEYAVVSRKLKDLAKYIDQSSESTCLPDGPNTTVTPVAGQVAVLQTLQQLQVNLLELEAGIEQSDPPSSVAAWEAAQEALASTHTWIFQSGDL